MKEELQKYLDSIYPYSRIETEHSLGGQVHIRFELGGEKENGTTERVNQAVERAKILFDDVFNNCQNEIWILIYEYEGENIYNASNSYLHEQFPKNLFSKFYNKKEKINSRFFIIDEDGNEIAEQSEVRIIIGKIQVSKIKVENILTGIANVEMGFKPGIDQRIFFFEPKSNIAFQMYDDRGCYIWSNKAETIKEIYLERNSWIVDYHRPEIDKYFK